MLFRSSRPQWRGHESISAKTILLHAEQGFGDTIQFCRYVPLVAKCGARVILEVQKPVDNRLKGRSSWLKVLRDKTEPAPAPKAAAKPPAKAAPTAVP